ncbi:vacuolar protein sorting-associated protein 1 [Stygiomarasmius scandens]|uniref:Vacuolar protein sorting-associated protein 1 n=1 Tax=Marasmiellus scandens TaxID=2682957 RepID=A0ABR1IJT4_9AGAR
MRDHLLNTDAVYSPHRWRLLSWWEFSAVFFAWSANKDLDVEAKKEEPSFFGSFFSSAKNGQTVKNTGPGGTPAPVMEAPPAVIKPQTALSERETMETEVIKLLIHSYFDIVKREMIDMVPKAITLTLVNHSKENLQRELLQELYKAEVLDDLLKESEYGCE